ncbi:Fis family transcriptional regulator [Methylocystis sp. H62]|jgi:hypothetical protein|uniref:Fis family transcriptional regulator n=1 Tax=Methylocystis sp. H62 TaxID=2785789 RepID=UPI0018C206C0|nr:Fis family transcriptional regulator [Methylocystis sp. H62]MBG0794576.1 Fis family transcriptional regulator [Methylocystis sp. H62]
MTKQTNRHVGSTLESWLDEQGIREEVTAAAIEEVLAQQLAAKMKKKGITKSRMVEMMETSRAQIDRLLDPKNSSATCISIFVEASKRSA